MPPRGLLLGTTFGAKTREGARFGAKLGVGAAARRGALTGLRFSARFRDLYDCLGGGDRLLIAPATPRQAET